MDFVEQLIADKANFLAYYFIINGIDTYSKINKTELFKKFELIIYSFDSTIQNITFNQQISTTKKQSKIDYFRKYVEQIVIFNKYWNINSLNYGTEGHILNFFNLNDSNYIKYLEIYLDIIKKNTMTNNNYTLDDYLNKLGSDIAIYCYMYNITYNIPIHDIIKNLFIKYFIQGFRITMSIHNIENFKDKFYKELNKYKNKYNINNDNINAFLQQMYNIVNYPIKELKDKNNNIYIIFTNTRILNFEIPENLYNVKELKFVLTDKLINNITYM